MPVGRACAGERGSDLTKSPGGEFVLLEQRPRAQSRAHVLQPARGVRDLPHTPSAQRRQVWLPQGRAPPRGEHGDPRLAYGARRHLPRRPLISRFDGLPRPTGHGSQQQPSRPGRRGAQRATVARGGRLDSGAGRARASRLPRWHGGQGATARPGAEGFTRNSLSVPPEFRPSVLLGTR